MSFADRVLARLGAPPADDDNAVLDAMGIELRALESEHAEMLALLRSTSNGACFASLGSDGLGGRVPGTEVCAFDPPCWQHRKNALLARIAARAVSPPEPPQPPPKHWAGCEWDPTTNSPTNDDNDAHFRAMLATVRAGNFHVCATCGELPRFKRFKKHPLNRPEPPQPAEVPKCKHGNPAQADTEGGGT